MKEVTKSDTKDMTKLYLSELGISTDVSVVVDFDANPMEKYAIKGENSEMAYRWGNVDADNLAVLKSKGWIPDTSEDTKCEHSVSVIPTIKELKGKGSTHQLLFKRPKELREREQKSNADKASASLKTVEQGTYDFGREVIRENDGIRRNR